MGSRFKDVRAESIRILRVLSYYYSFRDLEEILGVHFQNLWKYVNLHSMPEKDTAERILSKVRELKLVDRILDEELSKAGRELHILAREPGFLELFTLKFLDFMEREGVDKLDSVIALSCDAISLATVIALNVRAPTCYLMERGRLEKGGLIAAQYKSRKYLELKLLAVPKACLGGGDAIALVDIELDDIDSIIALSDVVRKGRDVAILAAFISIAKSYLEELASSRIKVLALRVV